jgi:thiamine biosynthesis lipoprotein
MTITRRRFISITAGLTAAACLPGRAGAGGEMARWSGIAMGARASLAIAGRSQAEARGLIDAAVAEIARMENLFSLYRPDSALSRLNRDGRLDHPPTDFLRLLAQCDSAHRLTKGHFDPTIQPVWALMAETAARPSDAALEAAYHRTGWQHVSYSPERIGFARTGMALTLNGIAQGYATDRVADLLRAAGLNNVLVNIGEIAALGERAPGRPWRIGIAEHGDGDPEDDVSLTDMAIATSSPLGTVFDDAGHAGHILAPGPSDSAPAKWRRVTVIHPSATLADALSTGMCLMDRPQLAQTLARTPNAQVITAQFAT